MKRALLPVMLAVTVAGTTDLCCQEAGFVSSANLSYDAPRSDVVTETSPVLEVNAGLRLELTGPLLVPAKSKNLRSVPGNVLRLVNPFAPGAPRPEYRSTRGRYSPHGWATLVGFNPGRSAFPDPRTHEPTLSLISVQKR